MIILLGNYGNFDLEKKFWNDEVSSINWLEDLIVCYICLFCICCGNNNSVLFSFIWYNILY